MLQAPRVQRSCPSKSRGRHHVLGFPGAGGRDHKLVCAETGQGTCRDKNKARRLAGMGSRTHFGREGAGKRRMGAGEGLAHWIKLDFVEILAWNEMSLWG